MPNRTTSCHRPDPSHPHLTDIVEGFFPWSPCFFSVPYSSLQVAA